MNFIPRWLQLLALSLLIGGSLTACLSDAAEPVIDLSATPLPGTAIAVSTPTIEQTATATEPEVSWIPSIRESGTGELSSPGLFFLNGPNAWVVAADLTVQQVTTQRRVRAVATRPGALTAAILMIDAQGGREAEVIRLVGVDGNESEPIYGPEITGDPAGNPRVSLLRWSPDGQQLAIVRDDGGIWLASPETGAVPLSVEPLDSSVEAVHWSPNGAALAVQYRSADDAGLIRIIHIESEATFDLSPLKSFGSFVWLPEPSRLVVSEDREAGPNPHAGSLFLLSVDGSERPLLLSAGESGPAIRIGRMSAAPDGAQIAFAIETPGPEGQFAFQSLYVYEIATGIRRQLEVARGFAVSDLWWMDGRLAWRAIAPVTASAYSGVEPFVIEVEDPETGDTKTLVRDDGG